MKRKHEIEAQIPWIAPGLRDNKAVLPKIRRQVERICEAVNVDFDSVAEIRIEPGRMHVFEYLRNSKGEFFRNDDGRIASQMRTLPVDTDTFLGDERDI